MASYDFGGDTSNWITMTSASNRTTPAELIKSGLTTLIGQALTKITCYIYIVSQVGTTVGTLTCSLNTSESNRTQRDTYGTPFNLEGATEDEWIEITFDGNDTGALVAANNSIQIKLSETASNVEVRVASCTLCASSDHNWVTWESDNPTEYLGNNTNRNLAMVAYYGAPGPSSTTLLPPPYANIGLSGL